MDTQRGPDGLGDFPRAVLPIALIVAGLTSALVGASSMDSRTLIRESSAPGSAWGYIAVGALVFLAGCALQVVSWILAQRRHEDVAAGEIAANARLEHGPDRGRGVAAVPG